MTKSKLMSVLKVAGIAVVAVTVANRVAPVRKVMNNA